VSLTSRRGFDLRSWIKGSKSSIRIFLACLVGFLLSWLVLWHIAPSINNDGATALYNLVTSNTAIIIVGSIATIGDLVWIPLVFYLYVFRKDPYDWTSSLVLAVAMVSAMALTTILKLSFGLPRPFQTPTLGIMARFETPTDHGLPSGHTTSAFTVATVVWARYPSWRIPFTLLGLATGTCMIILGLHFPSDVIAGAFLGIFCGTFAISLARFRSTSP
jgi:undecaprenyl-diphosphatase